MVYRVMIAAALAALLPAAGFAQQQTPPKPSEAGSPVAIGNVTVFESFDRAGARSSAFTCVSFTNLSDRPLSSVTFELSNRRIDGTATEVVQQLRQGPFAPGVYVPSATGNGGRLDPAERANCAAFAPARRGANDAVRVVWRPIAATFADGTVWHSATAPVVATAGPPQPNLAGVPVPPWDAAHHSGYVAVVSNGPQLSPTYPGAVISLYAPGRREPSAELTIPTCCVQSIAFDRAGDLLVATMNRHSGTLVYAPGAHEPTRSFERNDGFALASDAAGDIAIGAAAASGGGVWVFTAQGSSYRVEGQSTGRGLAMSPSGELAVVDTPSRTVLTYPAGSSTASRTIAVNGAPAAGTTFNVQVSYDGSGRLAVLDTAHEVVRVYERSATEPALTFPVPTARAAAFDDDGNLYVLTRNATLRYGRAGGAPATVLAIGGTALAVDRGGHAFAVIDTPGEFAVLTQTSGTQTVMPTGRLPRLMAISP